MLDAQLNYEVQSLAILVEVPLFIIEGADRSRSQPPRNAVEMEGMIADAPRYCALFCSICHLVRLTVNAWLHDVVLANGTIINGYVPSPQGNGVPFLDLESLGCFWFCFYHVQCL